MIASRYLYRALRALGIKAERFRDPLVELKALAGRDVACVVDGGAYRGTVSQEFLAMFPAAQVHSFEPQADLYEKLVVASANEPRWHIHGQALSDSEGEAVFHVPSAAFTGSLLMPGAEFGASREVTVQKTTLDIWAKGHGPVDVLKLDLQGAELQALHGAQSMLASVRTILCEVNFQLRYENCALFHEIASYLAGHGFALHRLYDIRSLPDGAWEMADAIFVRR